MIIICTEEIEKNFTMKMCLDSLEKAFKDVGQKKAINTVRQDMVVPCKRVEDAVYLLKTMGGIVPSMCAGAIRINSNVIRWEKVAGHYRKGKPTPDPYIGLVLLFSTETGFPLALFPDQVIQKMRVGATSALGAKYLSKKESPTVGLMGSGGQGRAQLRALKEVREIKLIRVYSPSRENLERFCRQMEKELEIQIVPEKNPQDIFRSEIVHTATNSMTPVFEAEWVQKGTHLSSLTANEVPKDFLQDRHYDVIVQSWSPIKRFIERQKDMYCECIPTKTVEKYIVPEAMDCIPGFHVADFKGRSEVEDRVEWEQVPGLGEVINGTVKGRTREEEITFFMNRGIGIQFAAVCSSLYELALERSLGTKIPDELLL